MCSKTVGQEVEIYCPPFVKRKVTGNGHCLGGSSSDNWPCPLSSYAQLMYNEPLITSFDFGHLEMRPYSFVSSSSSSSSVLMLKYSFLQLGLGINHLSAVISMASQPRCFLSAMTVNRHIGRGGALAAGELNGKTRYS